MDLKYRIKSSLDWASAAVLALFYIEVKRYKKHTPVWTDAKRKSCIFYMFEAVSKRDYARGQFSGIEEFQRVCAEAAKRKGWFTFDCAVDSMDIGKSGNMDWTQESKILNSMREVLEGEFLIPVTRIMDLVHG